jgi:hypothetical protein
MIYRSRKIEMIDGNIFIDGEDYGSGNDQEAMKLVDQEASNRPRAKTIRNVFRRIK